MEYGPFARESQPWPEDQQDMYHCPDGCEGEFMVPVKWTQTGERGYWHASLRCGECHGRWDGIFGERQIDVYDYVLDTQTQELTKSLRALERENMERYLDTMIHALAADLIDADDFA